jgi:hypothetical protein
MKIRLEFVRNSGSSAKIVWCDIATFRVNVADIFEELQFDCPPGTVMV